MSAKGYSVLRHDWRRDGLARTQDEAAHDVRRLIAEIDGAEVVLNRRYEELTRATARLEEASTALAAHDAKVAP